MDIRQLKYFCTLVEEKSYHAASEKLYLSQPALSQQISALEKELNTNLIKRDGRKSVATETGLMLYRKSKVIIDLAENTKSEVMNYNNAIVGSLRIATTSIPSLLKNKLVEFHKMYPEVLLEIREGTHDSVMEWLQSGVCELAITDFEQYDPKDIKRYCIDTMDYVAVGSKKYFEKGNKKIGVKDLKGLPLIINKTDSYMVKSCCEAYGFDPKIVAYVDSADSKINLVEAGIGVCLGSELTASLGKEKGLEVVKVEDIKGKIERCIFWKDDFSLSVCGNEFLNLIIEKRV